MALTQYKIDQLFKDVGELVEHADKGDKLGDLTRYQGKGREFVADVLKQKLTPQQWAVWDALEAGKRNVLVVGGNGLGKDHLLAANALFRAYVWGDLVILFGPGDRTVRESIMRRLIRHLWLTAKLPGDLFEMALRIPDNPRGGILAFSATEPERIVSHHSDRLWLGITEGQAITAELYDALLQLQATQTMVTANPVSPSVAAYGMSQSAAWTTFNWSCLEHPNVKTGQVLFPGAVTKEWVDSVRVDKGEQSRFWKVAVLGQWPEDSENPVIFAHQWDAAIANGRVVVGRIAAQAERFDSTRPGVIRGLAYGVRPRAIVSGDLSEAGEDETAVVVRVEWVIWKMLRWREPDSLRNAERIFDVANRLLREGFGVQAIVVDEIGIGRGTFDKLERLIHKLQWVEYEPGMPHAREYTRQTQLVGFKSSRKARDQVRYLNSRAEVFDFASKRFEEGDIAFHPDLEQDLLRDLRTELLAHEIRYTAKDEMQVTGKEDVRRTLNRSPDLTDAFVMSAWPDVPNRNRNRKGIARMLG